MGLLALFLTACSTTQIVREKPPAELLVDCNTVVEDVRTNGALTKTIIAYRSALRLCNIDKRSLREWADTE